MGVKNMMSIWMTENNLANNYEYIKMILKSFGLEENIDFWLDYDNALRLKRWKSGYEQIFRIVTNEELDCLVVYMRSIKNNLQQKEKYHVYRKYDGEPWLFSGSDAWYDCIKMLVGGE